MYMQQRLLAIDRKIHGIKNELLTLGEMRPGSLTRQVQDRNGKKYSYWQLSYTHKMRSRTDYVRPGRVKVTRRQVKAFKRFRVLVEAWVDLAIKHAQLSTKSKIED